MKIWIDNQYKGLNVPEGFLRPCIELILGALDLKDTEVSILLVDNKQIADLNLKYLNKSGPTNVIAFSMREGEGSYVSPHLLGDVVISLDAARAEAEQAGIPWKERLLSLLIHGILHLIGYDHMGDEEKAQQMAGEEGRILGKLKEKMPSIGLTTKGFSY